MSISIQTIQSPIQKEMEVFEKKFRGLMQTKVALLDTIMNFIIKRKGKQVRPLLVLLTSDLCGEVNERAYRGASLIELLHTATLVHDDVVDDAFYRRGFFSVNALWKNKIAVLVGDYLLSRGLLLSVDYKDFDLLQIVSGAVREMSEGELLQIEKSRKLNIDEETYFEIIRQKTATLIGACCAVGAAAAQENNQELIDKMREFGEKVGIAFQMKDDLFDFGTSDIGKPLGIDIKEKKLTLPLIYALREASDSDRKRILTIVRKKNKKPKKIKEVIEFVKASGGIQYTEQKMFALIDEAKTILDGFEDSPSKTSLMQLIDFFVLRKK